MKQELESKEGTSQETSFKDLSQGLSSPGGFHSNSFHQVPTHEPLGSLHHIQSKQLEYPGKEVGISAELVVSINQRAAVWKHMTQLKRKEVKVTMQKQELIVDSH